MKPSRPVAGSSEISLLEGKRYWWLPITQPVAPSWKPTWPAGNETPGLRDLEEALRLADENPDTLAVLLELCLPGHGWKVALRRN